MSAARVAPRPRAPVAPPAAAFPQPLTGMRLSLRAVRIVWHRDVLRLLGEPVRIVTALLQPLMFLIALGAGLGAVTGLVSGVPYRTFVYAGALVMPVVVTSVTSAASIVQDRELGFLREMLVSPVSRTAIVMGKVLGGMSVALLQGTVVLALAGVAGVPYAPWTLLRLFGCMAVLAFTFSSFAVLVAGRMQSPLSYTGLTQTIVQPLFFLSAALFPLHGLPGWLTVLTRLDPLTYAVDPIRRTVLEAVGAGAHAQPVTWAGTPVPVWLELLLLGALGAGMLWGAVRTFDRGA
ncbi:ABC transporter permease [Streptomyces sp. NPDC001594]|uniref:ABC transporter permease n=1 Tax=Streptomyces sp. NPDC001594 TaxID=3364590 RepID=UPI00368D653B